MGGGGGAATPGSVPRIVARPGSGARPGSANAGDAVVRANMATTAAKNATNLVVLSLMR